MDSAPPIPAPESDEDCVKAMAQGDERGLHCLYDRHAAVMYGLALRITGNPDAAADATVASLVQAWNSAARYRALRGSVAGWLTTMVRVRSLELVRSNPPGADDILSRGHSPLVVALPEETQQVLSLVYFGGWSQQDVAAHLGLGVDTVRRHVETGMRALRVLRESR